MSESKLCPVCGEPMVSHPTLLAWVCPLAPAHARIAADAERIAKRNEVISALESTLTKAKEHLEYCGYGDSYERECARDERLPETIDAALAATQALDKKEG